MDSVRGFWQYLVDRGWEAETDPNSGALVGARKPGPHNHSVASCETGFAKSEFSLAHVGDLAELERAVAELREELRPFCEERGLRFLAYGIHPVTPPGQALLMKKTRTSVWDRFYRSNEVLPPERGDDMHLFTVNAASHLHVSVAPEEAIRMVNVLNGFAGAQLALTADSPVWQGRADKNFKCVAEKFWDWWIPEEGRVGVPVKAFTDTRDYVETVAGFRPVYVTREGRAYSLCNYDSFADYFRQERAVGIDPEGNEAEIVPQREDLDLHGSCYWFNARVSRYYTVENRTCDQQPPGELLTVAALTLGLAEAVDEAWEEVRAHDWALLRQSRDAACRQALAASADGLALRDWAGRLLELAETGLRRRGKGEEAWLEAPRRRLAQGCAPADDALKTFRQGGVDALLASRAL